MAAFDITGGSGAVLFRCSYSSQNTKILHYNISAPNDTSILLNHLIILSEFTLCKFHFMLNTTFQLANVNVELDEGSTPPPSSKNFLMRRLTPIFLQKRFLRKLLSIGQSVSFLWATLWCSCNDFTFLCRIRSLASFSGLLKLRYMGG